MKGRKPSLKRFQKTCSHGLGRIREDEPKKVVVADTGAKSSSSIFFYPWLRLFRNRCHPTRLTRLFLPLLATSTTGRSALSRGKQKSLTLLD